MLDEALYTNLKGVLEQGLVDLGITSVSVKQRYQPTQQGANTGQMITFFKVSDAFIGSPHVSEKYDPDTGIITQTQRQAIESVFQIGALVTVDPKAADRRTASDLVGYAGMILQSQKCIQSFVTVGVGVQKVKALRNPYFLDDRDRFEADPSFDFTLSHETVIIKTSPAIEDATFRMYRI